MILLARDKNLQQLSGVACSSLHLRMAFIVSSKRSVYIHIHQHLVVHSIVTMARCDCRTANTYARAIPSKRWVAFMTSLCTVMSGVFMNLLWTGDTVECHSWKALNELRRPRLQINIIGTALNESVGSRRYEIPTAVTFVAWTCTGGKNEGHLKAPVSMR